VAASLFHLHGLTAVAVHADDSLPTPAFIFGLYYLRHLTDGF